MKPKTVIAPIAIAPIAMDRIATPDEIRAALFPDPDPVEGCATEALHEISSDLGGYIGIPGIEFEASLMLEELTLTGAEDTWTN
jgi:hypothetical protein